jgi:hypothetical protein
MLELASHGVNVQCNESPHTARVPLLQTLAVHSFARASVHFLSFCCYLNNFHIC